MKIQLLIITALLNAGLASANMFDSSIDATLENLKMKQTDDGSMYIASSNELDFVFSKNIATKYNSKNIERSALTIDFNWKLNQNDQSEYYSSAFKMAFITNCEMIFKNLSNKKMISSIKDFQNNVLLKSNYFERSFHAPSNESISLDFPAYSLEYYVSITPLAVDNNVMATCGVVKRYK